MPSLLQITTTIGYGSPNKANSYAVHGAALGAKEVQATRESLNWPYEPFVVPEEVYKYVDGSLSRFLRLFRQVFANFSKVSIVPLAPSSKSYVIMICRHLCSVCSANYCMLIPSYFVQPHQQEDCRGCGFGSCLECHFC